MALCAATALGFAAMLAGAFQIDAAHGITPAESMCGNGFSGFCVASPAKPTRRFAHGVREAIGYVAPAREARLIGRCDGVLMAGMEEDSFPAGCAWIEPIREGESR